MSVYYFAVCDKCRRCVFANSTMHGPLTEEACEFLAAHRDHEPRLVSETSDLQHEYERVDERLKAVKRLEIKK